MLRLRVLSDLHEEFAPRLGELDLPEVDADITILAGDIGNGLGAIEVAKRACFANTKVLLVPGNHEYYGGDLESVLAAMESASLGADRERIQCLHKKQVQFGDVRIIGVTLWTDYALHGIESREQAMRLATPFMVDYRAIDREPGKKLTAADTIALHAEQRAWLVQQLSTPWQGKTVVVTHHAPHPNSVAARFAGNSINGGFVSDLSELMPGVDIWIHGHTHDGFDYVVQHADGRSTRVVANPAGYRKRDKGTGKIGGFEFENPSFNPTLTVEL